MKKQRLGLILVIVLLMAALVGCSSIATSVAGKVGTATNGSEVAIEKATIKFMKDTSDGGYQLPSTEDLNKWVVEGKEMIIIDTMPADSFQKGRILGALNAELPKTTLADATDEQKQAFISLLGENKDTPIVVYCGFVGCARSHVGAVIAMEQGFTNVYRVPGGIVAWQEAGYEVEK
ncbi:rhodanese-like domain-containing protein [Alkaliphilus sp. MSJ-5]|uniref:Rhodanese-like domain-containing protein n=1 Tax=Alkaliphilus flagellatus TaxID=2841507 RepID=A0ABS6G051_9FIRM|nr:rhodanese-like domain-containing protein [Alkaliphilus flagellatus]MBU5675723.1 rhodanese-like domain-containing protein [Alkaliphilus flagellatus]